jgi:hypothetical protein
MHKRIRLAIVTHEEAEALHRIEEFHGSLGLFAGQLALRRGAVTLLHSNNFADNLQILRRDFAAAINQIEFKLLTFCKAGKPGTLDRADMDEHVLSAAFLSDKAEALLAVEKLYGAFARADDLSRHAVKSASAAATTTAAGTTTATAARATTAAATTEAVSAAAALAIIAIVPAITATKIIARRGK